MTQMIVPTCRFSFPLDDTVAVTAAQVIIRTPLGRYGGRLVEHIRL